MLLSVSKGNLPNADHAANLANPQRIRIGITDEFFLESWSGRVDLNHRPPGPEPGALARLRYAPKF
jgi:hypothetical protein